MAEGEKDFLEEMLNTGLDKWPNVTYLIGIIKDKDGSVIFHKYCDSSGQHTEMKMLSDQDFLEEVKNGGVDIILTSNYSPCSDCAAELETFYNKNKGYIKEFTIQFSRLFRINKEENKKGLQNLNEAGITLKAMTRKSWFDVVMRFMFDLEPDKIRERDAKTRNDLEKLLKADAVEELVEGTNALSIT